MDGSRKNREKNGGKKQKHRIAPKISEQYLQNAALFYLQRFSSSCENLRRVLMRKAWRSARVHETDMDLCAAWIDGIIVRYREAGMLDDVAYAEAKTQTLRERGNSSQTIRAKLMAKGIPAHGAEDAISVVADRDGAGEMAAAIQFARRRRIGPFGDPKMRSARRGKGLAALARAGFSYELALKIVDAEADEVLV